MKKWSLNNFLKKGHHVIHLHRITPLSDMVGNMGGFVLLKYKQDFGIEIVVNQQLKVIKEDHVQVIKGPVCAPNKLYIPFHE